MARSCIGLLSNDDVYNTSFVIQSSVSSSNALKQKRDCDEFCSEPSEVECRLPFYHPF